MPLRPEAKNEPQPVRLTSDSSFLVMLRMPNSLQTDDVMLLCSTAHCTSPAHMPIFAKGLSDIALQFIQSPGSIEKSATQPAGLSCVKVSN